MVGAFVGLSVVGVFDGSLVEGSAVVGVEVGD